MLSIYEEDPKASFGFIGANGFNEDTKCTKRYRVYSRIVATYFSDRVFYHKEYIEKTINNFMILKNLSQREINYKLISKGLKRNDIEDYMYENSEELKEYEIKSASNIIFKKSNSMEKEEIKQYLLKKGYKLENINMAFENK